MLSILTLTLLVGLAPAPVHQESRPAESTQKAEVEKLKTEFYALLGHYQNAFEGYRFDLREALRQGKPESDVPEHPSKSYFGRFLELAERGSPWAMAWVIENLEYRYAETEVVITESKRWYERLFRDSPNHDSLLRATRLLPAATSSLGDGYVLGLLQELYEKTTREDVKGNALWGMGTALRLEGAEEAAITMFEQLVQRYPTAPLARDAALVLFPLYQDDFLQDLTAWATKLEADAESPASCSIDLHAQRMGQLAQSGILQARQWTSAFHSNWVAAGKHGDGQAMLVLAKECGTFQGALQGPWIDLMIRLRCLLVTRWPEAAWQEEGLRGFVEHCLVMRYEPALLAPFFDTLAVVATTERAHAAAAFGRAMLATRGRSLANLEAGLGAYAAFLIEYPDSDWAKPAQQGLDTLGRVMPGKVLELTGRGPDGKSLDLTQFRGSIVLVDFFSFNSDACDERVRLEGELLGRLEGKPVVLLGVCLDSLVGASFTMQAEKHGVDWPCISDLALRRQLVSKWHVRHFPTAFVVDPRGIIVTRNEPWDVIVSTIDGLLAD